MATITPELLAEIREKAEKAAVAAPGIWAVHGGEYPSGYKGAVYAPGEALWVQDAAPVAYCWVRKSKASPPCELEDLAATIAAKPVVEANATHIARMDPPTTLALVAALEEAQRERDALRAENEKLREALSALVRLNDDYSPFGGELLRDRIDAMWDHARAALKETTHDD